MKSSLCAVLLLLAACSKSGSSTSENREVTISKTGAVTLNDPQSMQPEQKFLSLASPGPWDKQKSDHIPFAQVRETGRNQFEVQVTMPFEGEASHYTENIILLNHRMQELNKADFKRGNKSASAKFTFTRKPEDRYFVIAKCSMHDTWQTEVLLPKIKKEE